MLLAHFPLIPKASTRAIQSADPNNLTLETNVNWIGSPVAEM